jgi:hypothetical protein
MRIETKFFGIDKNGAGCREIRGILRTVDPLFDVAFNNDKAEYIIYYNGGFFKTVPFDDMTRKEIRDIWDMWWLNFHGDIVAEVDEHNKKLDLAKERKREDMIHEMSKDLRWAILKDM